MREALKFDVLLPLVLLAAAFGLWQYSLRVINVSSIGQFGLLPLFPIAFFAALGLVVYSFVFTLTRPDKYSWLLSAHICLLIFILHGTAPSIFSEPRYPWVYKHFGVVNYIQTHKAVNGNIDIYQNWPGFFAGSAWLSSLMGLRVDQFAQWSQVFFNLTYLLELTFIYQALRVGYRVRWLAIFFFFAANWVGQDYFSPQAFALMLSLAVFGITLAWLRSDPIGPGAWLARKISPMKGENSAVSDGGGTPFGWRSLTPRPWNERSQQRWTPLLIALGLFTVMTFSHQLSPYMVLVGLGLLTAIGSIKPRWFVVALGAIALIYLFIHYAFIREHFGPIFGGGDPLANAKTNGQVHKPSAGVNLVADTTRILAVLLWTLGVIGFIRRLRNGKRDLTIGALAISPFVVLGGQNYGGEAIFRVYLFSLPWFSLLAAYAVLPRRIAVTHLFIATRAAVLTVGLVLFLASYFGLEQLYQVTPNEVAAANYFYDNAPKGSVIFSGSQGLPSRLNPNYYKFADPNLSIFPELTQRVLGPADMPAIVRDIDSYDPSAPAIFMAFSRSAELYAHGYGQLPDGALQSLQKTFAADPGWKLWHQDGDVAIYQQIRQK